MIAFLLFLVTVYHSVARFVLPYLLHQNLLLQVVKVAFNVGRNVGVASKPVDALVAKEKADLKYLAVLPVAARK